jgi:Holliday junction resolvase RusA-like endonuclease
MSVRWLTPEQIASHQARMKRIGAEPVVVCGNCAAPKEDGECRNPDCLMSKPRPSPALKEALGQARAVVEAGMSGKARAFVLRLPVPQSVNHNTRPTLSGGRILTDEHKAWRQTVALAVYDAKIAKLYGRLRVYIRINAPRVDIDNTIKPSLDALQRAGAIDNDRQVDDLHVVRSTLIPAGQFDIEVAEL